MTGPEQRLQRRRAQHRVVDANRRQRETDAIARLRTLTAQEEKKTAQAADKEDNNSDSDSEDAGEEGEEDVREGERKKKQQGRMMVLEASIAVIEQLTAACKRSEAASEAKSAQLARLSHQLDTVAAAMARASNPMIELDSACASTSLIPLPATLPDVSSYLVPAWSLHSLTSGAFLSYLEQADRSHTLCQTGLGLLSSMCVFIKSVPHHTVIDVNNSFLRAIGARRSEVLYQPVELVALKKNDRQYPASVAKARLVLSGEIRRCEALWRCRTWDGSIYEVTCIFWGDFDVQPAYDGERKPDRMLVMFAPEDVVYLDDIRTAESKCSTISLS